MTSELTIREPDSPVKDGPLTAAEKKEYARLLSVVRQGFLETGRALMDIRDKRLYREEYSSFEAFCKEKFDLSKPHAIRLISAYNVVDSLKQAGATTVPGTERVARELSGVPEEMREQVWEKAQELAGDKEPDSQTVKEALLEIIDDPDIKDDSRQTEIVNYLRKAERSLDAVVDLVPEAPRGAIKLVIDLTVSIGRQAREIKNLALEQTKADAL